MNDQAIKNTIIQFIENRAKQKESTTSRHIHRRFDIPLEKAGKILLELSKKNIIEKFYDQEYQENRYAPKT